MKPEFILLVIVSVFLCLLLVALFFVYKPFFPIVSPLSSQKTGGASSNTDSLNDIQAKIRFLEKNYSQLTQEQKDQADTLRSLQTAIVSPSAQPTISATNRSILAFASTKGSGFTTSSVAYSPMGMYVNINCPKSCDLWINFYTSSKNSGTPSSAIGFINTYNIFLDNIDQSIYSQASYYTASSSVPISISATISVSAGIHTVDIRAKTTGGTLQSDSSALQVMAIER